MSDSSTRGSWSSTITSVDNPLKFFALCLLIVEALIAVLAFKSTEMLYLSFIGMSLFLFVVIMVVFMMIRRPETLTAKAPSELVAFLEKIEKKAQTAVETISEKERLFQRVTQDVLDMSPTEEPPEVNQRLPKAEGTQYERGEVQ